MPKNRVDLPITDLEIRFAHLLLAGEMTDKQAAEAAGINPSTANRVKAKPQVRRYMVEHRASVQAAIAKHEAKALIKFNITREQALQRLWEIANLNTKETRGSASAQVLAVRELFEQMDWSQEHREDLLPVPRAKWMEEERPN